MPPPPTSGGSRRYRYYTCVHAQKRGWDQCPSKSIPGGPMEAFVVEQIRGIARNPALVGQAGATAYTRDGPGVRASPAQGRAGKARADLAALDPAWPALTTHAQ